MVTPLNVSDASGVFTVSLDGVFDISIERVYINEDTNPSSPIDIFIDIRKNGVSVFTRDAIIPTATATDEPATISFTTPIIVEAVADDYFEFYVKAEEGTSSPSDTTMTALNFSVHKL